MSPYKEWLQNGMAGLLILAVAASVFLYNTGRISLWDPDEPRGAVIAYEMLKNRDWIHLTYNGEPLSKTPALVKPPLYYWSIAAFSSLRGGVDELSARLPSVLAGMGTACLVFVLGTGILGRGPALLGTLIFISNHMIFEQARSAEIDMSLCFLITLALSLFYGCSREALPRGAMFAAYGAAGLAVLAKGPVGLVVPALIALVYLLAQGKLKTLPRFRPLTGLLVVLLVSAPWFLVEGRAFGAEFFFRQNFERFFHAFDHQQPFYYYLVKLPVHFLPWTLLLPAAAAYWLAPGKEKNPGRTFLTIWVLCTFVFFSLSESKRSLYIVPLYPALSLLVGEALYRIALDKARRRHASWIKGGGLALGLLLVLAGGAGLLLARNHFPDLVHTAALLFLATLIAAAAMVAAARRPGPRSVLALFLILALGLEAAAAGIVYPELDSRSRSSRRLCRMVAQEIGTRELGCVGFHPPSAVFYINRETGRTLQDFGYRVEQGIAFLRRPETVYCLMRRGIYERERERLREIAHPVPVPGLPLKGWKWDLVFLTNGPLPGPKPEYEPPRSL